MICAEAARLHAGLRSFRARVIRTLDIIRGELAGAREPYVAFSAGKDSAALMHLVHSVSPATPGRILLWPESPLLGDFAGVIAAWRARGVTIDAVELTRDSLDARVAGRWQALHRGASHVLLGLRAEESRARRITLRRRGIAYLHGDGLTHVHPLAWWSTQDVAALVVTHALPVLATYATDGFEARTSSRVPRPGAHTRDPFLARLRDSDAVAYRQLAALYPEIETGG